MRQVLDQLPAHTRTTSSAAICETIAPMLTGTVALFYPTPREPDLTALLDFCPAVTFCFPRVLGEGKMEFQPVNDLSVLRPGAFGIPEPSGIPAISPSQLSTIICPGVAFTKDGLRLGQGGGYYDRFLIQAPDSRKIGTCFSCQIVSELSTAPHDQKMHRVISF